MQLVAPTADRAQRPCHSRGQDGESVSMVQALTSLLVFGVLHYVFKPVLDEGAETLGHWLGRRSFARQERRQRRSAEHTAPAPDTTCPYRGVPAGPPNIAGRHAPSTSPPAH